VYCDVQVCEQESATLVINHGPQQALSTQTRCEIRLSHLFVRLFSSRLQSPTPKGYVDKRKNEGNRQPPLRASPNIGNPPPTAALCANLGVRVPPTGKQRTWEQKREEKKRFIRRVSPSPPPPPNGCRTPPWGKCRANCD
jgi:hypothetical protein